MAVQKNYVNNKSAHTSIYTSTTATISNSAAHVKTSTFRKLAKNYKLWFIDSFPFDFSSDSDPKRKDKDIISTTTDEKHPVTDISSLFVPVVKYLRFIGFCPLTICQDQPTDFVTFEFHWKSLLTVYSICISAIFGGFAIFAFLSCLWICFTYQFLEVLNFQGFDIKRSDIISNYSRVAELGTRLVPATFPLFSIVAVFGTLASLPNFFLFLNQWSSFQREYNKTFPQKLRVGRHDPFISLCQYRNGTFAIFLIVGFLAIAVVFSSVENFWGGHLFWGAATGGVPRFTATFTMLIMVGGHGNHFLMFRTLMEAFKQIHSGIKMWKTDAELRIEFPEDYQKELQENLKKWTTVVLLAKKQVEYTGKAVACHHLATIFINFIYLCLGVFSCVLSRLGSVEENRGYILLMFCAWGFSLLTVKAFMCEQITEEERMIVDTLRKLEVNDYVPALIRLNSLIDLIVREPAFVRFWNVLTLNKSFLVQLIGQVATYIIVLIQFDNVVAKP